MSEVDYDFVPECTQVLGGSVDGDNTLGMLSLWKGPILPTGQHIRGLKGIAEDIAAKHHISVEALRGHSRRVPLVRARQEFMWRAYEVRRITGQRRYSQPQIGEFLDGRDHTTVHPGWKRHMEIAAKGDM